MKVITVKKMQEIDAQLFGSLQDAARCIDRVGKVVAQVASNHLEKQDALVLLLIGKGNKGADAFATGTVLLEKGYRVVAYLMTPLQETSVLCQQFGTQFQKAGGKVKLFSDQPLEPAALLIDGLLGTGFQGAPKEGFKEAIDAANRSGCPIISIDLPSGLNGTTGEVVTVAISATVTCYAGLPKLGLFIGSGWNHIGSLIPVDLGVDLSYVEGVATLLEPTSLKLPPIMRNRNKYSRGYLLAVAGSLGMVGAARMATLAAMRAGAGIVRLFHSPELKAPPLFPELLFEPWSDERILEEAERASAIVMGPGMGRIRSSAILLEILFSTITLPCVIDADALFLIAENPDWNIPKRAILTPHRGEMKRLLGSLPQTELEWLAMCQEYAERKGVILLLKGAPTAVFAPGVVPAFVTTGDPGMATAGSGDVLTGVVGALLAQGVEPYKAALLGATLHGLAGEAAALEKGSYCLMASDIIDSLPEAFRYQLTNCSIPS